MYCIIYNGKFRVLYTAVGLGNAGEPSKRQHQKAVERRLSLKQA